MKCRVCRRVPANSAHKSAVWSLHVFSAPASDPFSYGGQDIAHAVVVADMGMFVVWRRIAGLGGKKAGPGNQPGIIGKQCAAAGCGDDFSTSQSKT